MQFEIHILVIIFSIGDTMGYFRNQNNKYTESHTKHITDILINVTASLQSVSDSASVCVTYKALFDDE